jgi:hypothetical protein
LCFSKTGFDFSENRTSLKTKQDLASTKTVFGENKNRTSPRTNQYLQIKTGRLVEVSSPVRSGSVIISLADQGAGDGMVMQNQMRLVRRWGLVGMADT